MDPDTCAVAEVPNGCKLERASAHVGYVVRQVHHPEHGLSPSRELSTTLVRELDLDADVTVAADFAWARGVGKVVNLEYGKANTEERLVDYCLPADGCTRAAPDPRELERCCKHELGRLQECWSDDRLTCADVDADADHCGRCGAPCPAGQLCARGGCVTECPSGTTRCGSGCVDLTSDVLHCGECNVECGAGQACVSSQCAAR